MQTLNIKYAGSLTFWTPRACGYDVLHAAMHAGGLAKYLPEPRTDRSALEHALQQYAVAHVPTGWDWEVKKLKKAGIHGYEVLWVHLEELENTRRHACSYAVDNGTPALTHGYGDTNAIRNAYNQYKNLVPNESIGKILVRLATERLNGLSLRPNGGLYWIPEQEIALWEEYATCIENASQSTVTTGAWEVKPSTIAAIRESLLSTVETECARIMTDLSDGRVHDDIFFDNRSQDMRRLLERVTSVESALQLSLEDCRSRLQLVESVFTAATMATL